MKRPTTQRPKKKPMESSAGLKAGDDLNANDSTTSSGKPSTKSHITVSETIGDLFATPRSTLLLHACNCEGSWGGGIAKAFKSHYPAAFEKYNAHCKSRGAELLGSCFLIPPQLDSSDEGERDKAHWIGCLFTSVGKGKKKGSVESILEATGAAMRDLLRQVRHVDREAPEYKSVGLGEMKMCKINSGLFGVPWERTKAVIEQIEIDEGYAQKIEVITREE